jgi:hypothetical protein
MKKMKIKKTEKTLRLSTFEKNKIMVSKMSDKELGLLVKKMSKKINFLGVNIYGESLYMTLNECLKRTTTTDVNVREGQDEMRIYIFRKNLDKECKIKNKKMKLNKNKQIKGLMYHDKNTSSLVNSFNLTGYSFNYTSKKPVISNENVFTLCSSNKDDIYTF